MVELAMPPSNTPPSGNQLWVARLDSTNVPSAAPAGLALDGRGQPALTGNAGTVKYDFPGSQLWTAPYAGLAIAADTNGNTFVTGYGTSFNTIKLSPSGTNLWVATSTDVGPTIGQAITVDSSNNVVVSGSDVYLYSPYFPPQSQLLTVKFASNGASLWNAAAGPFLLNTSVEVGGMSLDAAANSYVVVNFFGVEPGSYPFQTYKYSPSGGLVWAAAPEALPGDVGGAANGLAVAPNEDVVLTGKDFGAYTDFFLATNGVTLWTSYYPLPVSGLGSSASLAVATDLANNCYITGYSPDANGTNDIVTIAYDTNGKQLWLQRYSGLGYGAVGNAIAADHNGNIYVAGYDNVPGGGTEMVLIKYSPAVTLQHQSNGNFLLQAQGTPNEPFDIQATTNLQRWLDLGTQEANTNGLLQYLDTNAAWFPWRFYLAIPQ
jgi:hypothetical protein